MFWYQWETQTLLRLFLFTQSLEGAVNANLSDEIK